MHFQWISSIVIYFPCISTLRGASSSLLLPPFTLALLELITCHGSRWVSFSLTQTNQRQKCELCCVFFFVFVVCNLCVSRFRWISSRSGVSSFPIPPSSFPSPCQPPCSRLSYASAVSLINQFHLRNTYIILYHQYIGLYWPYLYIYIFRYIFIHIIQQSLYGYNNYLYENRLQINNKMIGLSMALPRFIVAGEHVFSK